MRKWGPNPLDRILEKAIKRGHKTFLIFWNRGLGDIPLGLYALVHHIKREVPDAKITFLTRPDLYDGFQLLEGVDVIVAPNLKRGEKVDIRSLTDTSTFDVVIEWPDPTHWVKWQLGVLTPKLKWQDKWDALCKKYNLDPNGHYIGAHVQSETTTGSWRDWPLSSWQKLFVKCTQEGKKILLFGFAKNPPFHMDGVIDLRGETPLFDLLSIIKNHCDAIVVPDSGVSSMVYYLNEEFPLKQVALWSSPDTGILKQKVASPNAKLQYIPLIGQGHDITKITPEQVYEQLC